LILEKVKAFHQLLIVYTIMESSQARQILKLQDSFTAQKKKSGQQGFTYQMD